MKKEKGSNIFVQIVLAFEIILFHWMMLLTMIAMIPVLFGIE